MITVAYAMADRSTCSRRNNGAVIATDRGVVLSTGYNGSLSGMPHCDHDCNCEDLPKPTITDTVWMGPDHIHNIRCNTRVSTCPTAVHAEANAVYFGARHGVRLDSSIIYCTTEPCRKCAEAVVQAGIRRCVYYQDYRTHEGLDLLRAAGVEVVQHSPSIGVSIVKGGGS